ncbi:MAG: OB-fold domain-containing protein [Variovorax sp.]
MFTTPFWDALSNNRWTSTRCTACGHLTFPPKVACPQCWSSAVQWEEIGDAGVVYSWSRIHAAPTAFAAEAPLCVSIVDLDCGLRLACKLLEPQGREPQIGMRVRMVRLSYQDGDFFAARPEADVA